MEIDEIIALRDQVWSEHPVITELAILPTLALKDAVAKTWETARKGRGSIAFLAQPLSGKSSCAQALVLELKRKKPGCGVNIFEIVEDTNQAEGRLLSEILYQIDYAPKILRDLAGKRMQVHRALLALSGEPKHLFLIFDEAQEMSSGEFAWLKSVINRLVRDQVKVTVVLFGQVELKARRAELREARSDLEKRFMSTLHELNGLRSAEEVREPLLAIDENSRYPVGTDLTYTQLLLPRFFAAGGRIHRHADDIWQQLKKYKVAGKRDEVSMSIFSAYIAKLFQLFRDLDSPDLVISPKLLKEISLE